MRRWFHFTFLILAASAFAHAPERKLLFPNSSLLRHDAALHVSLTNVAVLNDGNNPDLVSSNVLKQFLAKSPETFGYDPDSNLTNDGRFTYTWDLAREIKVNCTRQPKRQ